MPTRVPLCAPAASDRDNDGKVTFEEWRSMMLHGQETDTPYWEQYGERDMNVGLKVRKAAR